VEELFVNGHRVPWTKRGARRVGELEWRQREVREKERGAHNKEGQSVSGERPRSGKSHSKAWELAKRLFGYNGYERPSKAEASCSPEARSCAT